MKIGFFLSTLGGSPLQVGLERGLRALGHNVEDYRIGRGYDLLLVFVQSAHTTNYVYPEFPPNNQPLAFIDNAEYGYFTRLPDRVHRFANCFAPGAMAHDTKNPNEQMRLRRFLEGRSFPYFLREFSKLVEYPSTTHPIDYPLYAGSECHEAPNLDEYLKRDLDLFVSWGGSHPWRMNLTQVLRDCHTKCEISVLGENGATRLPQSIYFPKTRSAKCSVSFDGYGSGSFRVTEVLCRTVLLMGPLMIKVRAPLIDGETCISYDVQNDGENFTGTNIGQKLRECLDNPESSFEIYRRGYDHVHTHLSERATAAYVLDVVSKHDCRVPTPLDIVAS